MKRKLTIKDVENILRDAANQICDELNKEKILAHCLMEIAKEDLIATFTDKQKELYEKYVETKQIDKVPDNEKIIALRIMDSAKKDLIATFTYRQKKLYQKYVTAKQRYIDAVVEMSKATKK